MSGHLLNAIETSPADAIQLFLNALENFHDNFMRQPFARTSCLARPSYARKTFGHRIIEITKDGIEEKMSEAIKKEIDKNFFDFCNFLNSSDKYSYRITCQLKDCFTVFESMGEHHYDQSCVFEFEISKNHRNAEGFSGFYIRNFNPVISYEKLIDKAKEILKISNHDSNSVVYADAAFILIETASKYTNIPFLLDEAESLVAIVTDSLKNFSKIISLPSYDIENYSWVLKSLLLVYAKLKNTDKMEDVLEYFTNFNLNTYFSSFTTNNEYARIFYNNSVLICRCYNNPQSVIEFARKFFEYADNHINLNPQKIYNLQEHMINQLENSRDVDNLSVELAVAILEYMLHFTVTLFPTWNKCVTGFVNDEIERFKDSPEELAIILGVYESRIALFNKRFHCKYADMNKLGDYLSKRLCEVNELLDEPFYVNDKYSFPVDISANFFNMVIQKEPYVVL